MKRMSFAIGLVLAGAAATLFAPTAARAQPAFAIGHPLPAPDFDVGEISVRDIAGSVAKPVIGVEVTLTVAGAPRVARTDEAGRAFFKELPAGAPVQAIIKDEDGKDVQSDTFPVPTSGGLHVMLSTRPVDPNAGGGAPFAGGGGGAGPMAGGGGMPDPRKISGLARPEQKNAAGTLTVRVLYGSLTDKVPGIPVTLAAYASDGKVAVETKQTDSDGRAAFADLDVSGGTAYYAMAQVPRNGKLDRLVSAPVVLESQTGMALLLSTVKQDATDPVVDDQGRLDKQNPELPPGAVEVALDGDVDANKPVSLFDASTRRVIGHVSPDRFPADPANLQAGADLEQRPDESPGTLDIAVHGGMGTTDQPMAGVTMQVFSVEDQQMTSPTAGTTNASGIAHFDLKPGVYRAQVMVNGKPLGSQGLDVSQHGLAMSVLAQWEAVGRPRALFQDIPVVPGQTVYAEALSRTNIAYRSAPFQLTAEHGTSASIREVPVFFTFHVIAGVEDQLLAVQGQFTLMNFSWAPYKATADGLDIPLPHGFKGAVIADRDQQVAAVAAGVGFRVPRPLAPAGPTVFKAGFSLPVDGGSVEWQQDLPLGTVESWMKIVQMPTMSVEAPPGSQGTVAETEAGPMYQIPRITIPDGHSMVLKVHGLPQPPAWKIWLPRLVGILVILVIGGGIAFAVTRAGGGRAKSDPAREARRARLMDELVELERSGKDARRRESLLAELEKLWDDAA